MRARAQAREATEPGHWLSFVLDHHEMIEQAFAETKAATSAEQRIAAARRLATILTGHSNAEEAVIYPEMADHHHKAHASLAYEEQAMTKIQLALLEKIDPMTQPFLDKLEHIRGAVTHHMYQEESSWLIDLRTELPPARQEVIGRRYQEEMARYLG
jgi:hemerythrin superfamily protein